MAISKDKDRVTVTMKKDLKNFIETIKMEEECRNFSNIVENALLKMYGEEYKQWIKQKDTQQ